jgi:hypothetical protein
MVTDSWFNTVPYKRDPRKLTLKSGYFPDTASSNILIWKFLAPELQ